jgi:hypothetical protein
MADHAGHHRERAGALMASVDKLLKVFLSSTAKDLAPYREAVAAAIRKLENLHSVRMEDWTAQPGTPRAVCEAKVRESDIFVGIVGHCYGSSPPDDERSFTEIEFDTAVAEGMPRLMFVTTDDFPIPVTMLRSESLEQAQGQEAFRKRVLATDTAARNFRTPDELVSGLRNALWNELQHRGRRAPPKREPALCTLPSRLGDFTGRERELDQLCAALTSDGRRACVSAVGGMGGVGKTALAVEAAWRVSPQFPDGVLFIDLRGIGLDSPLTPDQAVAAIVAQLEPAAHVPEGQDQSLRFYRRMISGRRLLLLLDNASDLAQVEPLAPPWPAALLVTSRRRMVLEGATCIELDVLPPREAVSLLRENLGERHVEEDQLVALAERGGHLPFALRLVASHLRSRPELSGGAYAALLAGESRQLNHLALSKAGLKMRAALELSLEALGGENPNNSENSFNSPLSLDNSQLI